MAFGKLKDFLKKDEDAEDIMESEEEYYEVNTKSKDKNVNLDNIGNKMILMEPRSFSETQAIADHLKKRNSVVVNLKRVTASQAKRIIDFLSGCIYSIGGSLQKISEGTYLCTPNNVSVEGNISDEKKKEEEKATEEDW